ncbi:sugar-binding transcriptional regulator [Roseivivax sediminis]|uniref:DNA-binding transcriptional regulator LsrR, DeoR family n=1 Tax=Roseivivax sediminis TaxID=936889 RepID=A0A1I2DAR7_9RHOB|nr:sugar-binding transcriptional regulator [Roseivivax sediminis]SFE77642.1 DNA-binding transcriptional regulator LsrR, DeoR family [Roseivivax sediminis]
MKTTPRPPAPSRKLDDAARAAWLAYVAGKTQDEIARILGVSRQSAQRLVSQAMQAGLVKVRIDHPISNCLDLAERLRDRYGLALCEVVPAMSSESEAGQAVAHRMADLIEDRLAAPDPITLGIGTGRTMRAAVEHLPRIDCPQHRIVSLTGNVAPDGSTAYYNVLFTLAEKVSAPTFPLPVPVIAGSAEERTALLGQSTLASAFRLAAEADLRVFGIGTMDDAAAILLDGFVDTAGVARLREKGAVGEIFGFPFDSEGEIVPDEVTERVCSASLFPPEGVERIAAAHGAAKIRAMRAAIRGGLLSGLVTDEVSAAALLDD